MTPEQQQAIKTHLDAISAILYDDSNPDSLQTLEDIELAVRDQVLTYVTPHIGFFYRLSYRYKSRKNQDIKKHCR